MKKNLRSYVFNLSAIGLGVLAGFLPYPIIFKAAEILSGLLTNFLQMITAPIVFFSMFSTLIGLSSFGEMKVLGKKVFKYTIFTTLLAASTALILFVILKPGSTGAALVGQWDQTAVEQTSYLSFFLDIIPSNLFKAFLENNVLGLVFVAFFCGIAAHKLPQENKQALSQFSSSVFKLILKVTEAVIVVMPFGIWAFTTLFVEEMRGNASQFKHLMVYLSVVLGANLIQGIVVIPLILKSKGLNPLSLFRGSSKALLLAFLSKSSNAALPVSLVCAEKNLSIKPKVANFSLPLCTTINMNGCAAFILSTVLFVSTMHGMSFSIGELIMWVGLATIAAIGNAGVPMGCFFLSSAFLLAMGVPIKMMGIILPFYAFIDMLETSLNVWSDISVTAIVDKEVKQEEKALTAQTA